MKYNLISIVATDLNWGIGKDGNLLTHLPGDLKYFKQKTKGKIVVMGRATFESLPGKKPLPNRTNIVLTRNKDFRPEGCICLDSLDGFFQFLKENNQTDDVFIIGGQQIYHEFLPYCNSHFVTKMQREFAPDTYYDNLDELGEYELVWQSETQSENGTDYIFTEYRRK